MLACPSLCHLPGSTHVSECIRCMKCICRSHPEEIRKFYGLIDDFHRMWDVVTEFDSLSYQATQMLPVSSAGHIKLSRHNIYCVAIISEQLCGEHITSQRSCCSQMGCIDDSDNCVWCSSRTWAAVLLHTVSGCGHICGWAAAIELIAWLGTGSAASGSFQTETDMRLHSTGCLRISVGTELAVL